MTASIQLIFEWLITALAVICSIVILMKCIWNLMIPYAMVLERTGKKGISVSPWVEFTPLMIGTMFSAMGTDFIRPAVFFAFHLGAIVFSYLHMFVAVPIFGLTYRWLILDRNSDHWLTRSGSKDIDDETKRD